MASTLLNPTVLNYAFYMCNRYETPSQIESDRFWSLGRENAPALWPKAVFPRASGPFIRRARNVAGYERELVVGQWGLIPWFAKEPKLKFPRTTRAAKNWKPKQTTKILGKGGSDASFQR